MRLAPVIVFAYNRPALLRQTLESLAANLLAAESELFIFCDGPKAGASVEQLNKMEEVSIIASEKKWCGTVTTIKSAVNKGLATSVIDGVTELMKQNDRVIVVEDDVLLSPHFLSYMNGAMEKYADRREVFAVGSWTYFTRRDYNGKAFFMRYPDSIAWGTFRRSWEKFEPDGKKILTNLREKKMLYKFNGFRNLRYFEPMLNAQIEGRIDSWAIRWTATSILNDGLTVFPPVSMSRHMGTSPEGTHEKTVDYNADLPLATQEVRNFPDEIRESEAAFDDWKNFIQSRFLSGNSRKRRIINFVREQLPVPLHNLIFP